ncbi:hypothetical protein K438DRAFT_1985135 [Mycena galopus ATCC 62051]|nr:hypothetical protein K438DRAFT_1985135 [Mycena galopus ATCC 62051]
MGGDKAAYIAYETTLNGFLGRAHAPALISLGGMYRFIGEVYTEDIVQHFARGPSLQVSQFDKGESRLLGHPVTPVQLQDHSRPHPAASGLTSGILRHFWIFI